MNTQQAFPLRPEITKAGASRALKYAITAKIGKSNPLAKMFSADKNLVRFMERHGYNLGLLGNLSNHDAVMFLPMVFKVCHSRIDTTLIDKLDEMSNGKYSHTVMHKVYGKFGSNGMLALTDDDIADSLFVDSVEMFAKFAAYVAIGSGKLPELPVKNPGHGSVDVEVDHLKYSATIVFYQMFYGHGDVVEGVGDKDVKIMRTMWKELVNRLKYAVSSNKVIHEHQWLVDDVVVGLYDRTRELLKNAMTVMSDTATTDKHPVIDVLKNCCVECYGIERTQSGNDNLGEPDRLSIVVVYYSHHLDERYIRHIGATPESYTTFLHFAKTFYSGALGSMRQYLSSNPVFQYQVFDIGGDVSHPTVIHQLEQLEACGEFNGVSPSQLNTVKNLLEEEDHDVAALADGITEIFELYDKMNVDSGGSGIVTLNLDNIIHRNHVHVTDFRASSLPDALQTGGWADNRGVKQLVEDAYGGDRHPTESTVHSLTLSMNYCGDVFFATVMLEDSDYGKLMAGRDWEGGSLGREVFTGEKGRCWAAYTETVREGEHVVRVVADSRGVSVDFKKSNITIDIHEDDSLNLVSSPSVGDSVVRMVIKIPNKEPFKQFNDIIHCTAILHG